MSKIEKEIGGVFNSAYISQSEKIFLGKGRIKSLVLSSGAIASELTLYDGIDVTGEEKIKITSPLNDSVIGNFNAGIFFHTGIYCSLSGAGAGATIIYEIL